MFNRAFGRLMFNESKAYKPGTPDPLTMSFGATVSASAILASSLSFDVGSELDVLGSRIYFSEVRTFSKANVSVEVLGAVFGETVFVMSMNAEILGSRVIEGDVGDSNVVSAMPVNASLFKWTPETPDTLDWTSVPAGTDTWSAVPQGNAQWQKVR